jgi:hypothetical protein
VLRARRSRLQTRTLRERSPIAARASSGAACGSRPRAAGSPSRYAG